MTQTEKFHFPLFNLERSRTMFEETSRVLVGGVGSADRIMVQPHPIFIERGQGSRMWDVDGNEYVDYLLGYGPLVLGHAHPKLVETIARQMQKGSIYGAGHPLEFVAAKRITELMPSMEQIRFGQSGTEAVQSAIRTARAATGRRAVVKFEGHYHGWADQVAVSYAPSEAEAGNVSRPNVVPMSEGQPPGTYEDVCVLPWNDLQIVADLFERMGEQIAAVLTEPISCNLGVIVPEPGFLEGLRTLCDQYGALLIFDEIQTGVRLHLQGAQALCGVTPDLTCLGKAISGGFPVSVIGGKESVMKLIADRRVYQAGTYNSNPLCLAAIPVVLDRLSEEGTYEEMGRLSHRLRDGLAEILRPLGGYVQGSTTVFGFAFGPGPIRSMREGWRNDAAKMMEFKRALRLRGVYTKPTPRDIWYVSTEHTEADIDYTLAAASDAIEDLT
jgi:glutamate-1-semialdehyde 2,1-aminomutase